MLNTHNIKQITLLRKVLDVICLKLMQKSFKRYWRTFVFYILHNSHFQTVQTVSRD